MANEPGISTSIVTDNADFDRSMKRSETALDGIENKLRQVGKAGTDSGVKLSRATRAMDAQGIEAASLQTQLARLENEYLDVGNAASRTAQRVTQNARGFRIMRGQLYNASIQMQDFAVQVGAGTSAITAFSQNAPQFLSFFGPKAAAIGALIAALPLLKVGIESLIGPAFDATKSMQELEKATEAYSAAVDNASQSISELYQQFGNAGPFMGRFYDDMQALAAIDLENKLSRINDELTDLFAIGGAGDRRALIADFFDLNIYLGAGRKEARALASAVLQAQEQLEAAGDSTEAQLAAQMALFKAMSDAARARDGISDSEQELLDLMEKQVTMTAQKFALENRGGVEAARAALQRATELADQERMLGEQLQESLRAAATARYEAEEAAARQAEQAKLTRAARLADQERMLGEQLISAMERLRREEIAKTEAALDRLFRARTVMYSIRFSGDASVMAQPVAPSGDKMNPGKTKEELLSMGVPEANLENFILKPPPSGGGRAGGGGGGAPAVDPFESKLEQLRNSLMSEEELERQSYQKRTELLEEFLQRQPEKMAEYQELMERSQAEHQKRMAEIDVYRYGSGLEKTEAFLGDMAAALQNGNEKMLRIAKVFGAAEALVNAWSGYAQVIGDPTVPWFAKIAKAAAVLSAGLGAVQAIKGVSPGGSSSGGGAAAVGGAAAAPAIPTQTVSINLQGDTFSRSSVEGLLEQIQSQLDRGGRLVFQ